MPNFWIIGCVQILRRLHWIRRAQRAFDQVQALLLWKAERYFCVERFHWRLFLFLLNRRGDCTLLRGKKRARSTARSQTVGVRSVLFILLCTRRVTRSKRIWDSSCLNLLFSLLNLYFHFHIETRIPSKDLLVRKFLSRKIYISTSLEKTGENLEKRLVNREEAFFQKGRISFKGVVKFFHLEIEVDIVYTLVYKSRRNGSQPVFHSSLSVNHRQFNLSHPFTLRVNVSVKTRQGPVPSLTRKTGFKRGAESFRRPLVE